MAFASFFDRFQRLVGARSHSGIMPEPARSQPGINPKLARNQVGRNGARTIPEFAVLCLEEAGYVELAKKRFGALWPGLRDGGICEYLAQS